jgi:hypothetical protein
MDPTPRRTLGSHRLLGCALLLLTAEARPQSARAAEPSHLQFGPLSLGIEATASLAPEDPAFYNFTAYYGNTLRTAALDVSGALRLASSLAVLAEVRTENVETPRVYALYLRFRPWADRSLDFQAGRVPPVFGSFARRPYGSGNLLVGHPLGYQYLATLRSDAVPMTADDLLAVRGGGWLFEYPAQAGAAGPAPGLPLVQGLRWDTGLEARLGSEPWQLAVAVTQGTLSNPRFRDDNGGKQFSARLGWTPSPAVAVGLSAARGEWLEAELKPTLPPAEASRTLVQRALGLDLECSRGHWLGRAEAIWSEWDLPAIDDPRIEAPLGALAVSLEGQRKLAPGLYLAARLDRLSFTRLSGSRERQPWDSPVSRLEVVLGYSLRRGLTLKGGYQHNWREVGPPGQAGFPLAQVVWRF